MLAEVCDLELLVLGPEKHSCKLEKSIVPHELNRTLNHLPDKFEGFSWVDAERWQSLTGVNFAFLSPHRALQPLQNYLVRVIRKMGQR